MATAAPKPGTGTLPDPKIAEKLDEAFGTEAEIAEQIAGHTRPRVLPLGDLFGRSEPEPAPLIYAKMIEVARKVSAVGKDSINRDQGYNFRGIDAVVNALHPAMAEVGVFAVPALTQIEYRDTKTTRDKPTREVTVQVTYTFYAEDGSRVSAIVPGESLDQADKGSAKAMSVAFRIALLQVFSLPTSDPDPDASYHTRDGLGAMAESVKTLLLESVPTVDPHGLATRLWPIVLEHSAAERAIGEATTTWADYFAQRFAELIDEIGTWEQGKAMADALRATNGLDQHRVPQGGGAPVTLLFLLDERARFIRQRGETRFNELMSDITGATASDDVRAVLRDVAAAFELLVIREPQAAQLNTVAAEKLAKLVVAEEMPQTEPWPPVTEPSGAGEEKHGAKQE